MPNTKEPEPMIDGESQVIRLNSHGVTHWGSGLRRCDRAGESNVIPFRSRGAPSLRKSTLRMNTPVDEIGMHECASESDNEYRHRMWVNIRASGVLIVLMITGYLVVNTMVIAKRDSQYCYRSGDSTCAEIYTASRQDG